jgi:DNA (cytosine-5)-methyltransferase 1
VGDQVVNLLSTPSAVDGGGGGRYSSDGHQSTLPGEVRLLRLLPTPKAHDGEFGTPRTTGRPIEKSTHLGTIASLEKTSHWGKYEPAIRRWEQIVGPAPAPTEPNKNGNPRLAAAFSQWLMGWPDGWVTDPDIGISRNDQLRIVGNGVVPQQAAAAIRYLLVLEVPA